MHIQIRPDRRKWNIPLACKFALQIIDYVFDIVTALITLSFHPLIIKINYELVFLTVCIFDLGFTTECFPCGCFIQLKTCFMAGTMNQVIQKRVTGIKKRK